MTWLTGLIGLGLVVSPFLFGYSGHTGALWSNVLIGISLIAISLFEMGASQKESWEYWLTALLGGVAVLAPFILGFTAMTTALWITLGIGAIALIASATKLTSGPTEPV